MLGAIAGDVIGSISEFHPWQGERDDFPLFSPKSRFTDESALTIALAQSLLDNPGDDDGLRENIIDDFHFYARKYFKAGFGNKFFQWMMVKKRKPWRPFPEA